MTYREDLKDWNIGILKFYNLVTAKAGSLKIVED